LSGFIGATPGNFALVSPLSLLGTETFGRRDADRTAGDTAGDTRTTDRTADGESGGKSAPGGATTHP
jgi:hypothetical protein